MSKAAKGKASKGAAAKGRASKGRASKGRPSKGEAGSHRSRPESETMGRAGTERSAAVPGAAQDPARSLWMGAGFVGLALLTAFAILWNHGAADSQELAARDEVRLDSAQPPETPAPSGARGVVPESLRVQIVARHPHDPGAFTQGLLWYEGRLFESTGLVGRSSLREVELESGEILTQEEIPEIFAEGLARAGERFIQLTWQDGEALEWSRSPWRQERRHRYEGEGWGLCHDGERLIMSDGSSSLTFRDPETFEILGRVRVTKLGRPLRWLNELECVGGDVYANVWQRDEIVRIDPSSGAVTATIDASGLLSEAEQEGDVDVLNGIAWIPERERFVITGKLWPWTFEVRFVPR